MSSLNLTITINITRESVIERSRISLYKNPLSGREGRGCVAPPIRTPKKDFPYFATRLLGSSSLATVNL